MVYSLEYIDGIVLFLIQAHTYSKLVMTISTICFIDGIQKENTNQEIKTNNLESLGVGVKVFIGFMVFVVFTVFTVTGILCYDIIVCSIEDGNNAC